MKKFILALLALSVFAFADTKSTINEDKNKSAKFYSYENSKIVLRKLGEDFIASTGDQDYDNYLKIASQDESWRLANYHFLFNPRAVSLPGKKTKYDLPDYMTTLKLFKHSLETTGNILSAYQGFRIIEKYFLYMGPKNDVVKDFLPAFSKALAEKNYCVGYLYYGRTFTLNYQIDVNREKALEIFKKGKNECMENAHYYYKKGIKHELAKINTMIKISKSKR